MKHDIRDKIIELASQIAPLLGENEKISITTHWIACEVMTMLVTNNDENDEQ